MLAPARIVIDHGRVLDLTDTTDRHEIEARHAALLEAHGMDHLDMHEITTRRRIVTQTITADAYFELAAAVIRFPSSRDGNPCHVLLEGRAHLEPAGKTVALTDPAPEALVNVCAGWQLELEPAPRSHALGSPPPPDASRPDGRTARHGTPRRLRSPAGYLAAATTARPAVEPPGAVSRAGPKGLRERVTHTRRQDRGLSRTGARCPRARTRDARVSLPQRPLCAGS